MQRTRVGSALLLVVGGAAISHRIDALIGGAPLAPNLVMAGLNAVLVAIAFWLNLRGGSAAKSVAVAGKKGNSP